MAEQQLTPGPIAAAAEARYAYGENDCLTLIRDLVASGPHSAATIEAVRATIEPWHAVSYPEAMATAKRMHGGIGQALMSELVEDCGLAPAGADVRGGDVILFEGTLAQVDGRTYDSSRQGTLEAIVDDLGEWWAWTTDGLRPVGSVYASARVRCTGGIGCLRRS